MNQEKSKNERNADFVISRLFIERICHFLPIKSVKKLTI